MTYHTTKTKRDGSRFRAFGEVIGELKKVHWPSRPEAARLTGIVLVVTIIFGIILGALDYGFAELAGKIFLGR
jgi:preprotein translocase SecE subunit